jgi:hypothetical protein
MRLLRIPEPFDHRGSCLTRSSMGSARSRISKGDAVPREESAPGWGCRRTLAALSASRCARKTDHTVDDPSEPSHLGNCSDRLPHRAQTRNNFWKQPFGRQRPRRRVRSGLNPPLGRPQGLSLDPITTTPLDTAVLGPARHGDA